MKKRYSTSELIRAALLCAAVFVAIRFLIIPFPIPSGYVHLGDAAIFLCGLLLPFPLSAAAAAVGATLADITTGFVIYVPFTVLVKAAVTLTVSEKSSAVGLRNIIGAISAAVVTAAGYFIADALYFGFPAALAGIPWNILQSAIGAVIALPAAAMIRRSSGNDRK